MVYRVPAVPWNCWNLKLKASNSRQCNYLEMNVVLEIPWIVLEYNLLILENFDWLMEILQQNQQVIFQHWIWFVLDMISISQSKKFNWLTECLSVHWHCRLGIRKNIQSVKIEWWGVGVNGVVISEARCRLFAYGPAISKPHHLLPHFKIQTGFTFLVPAYPGCPGKEVIKSV